ncbi:MAG: DegV family protein [Candidatus Heimdallarchaeota archaeon]
MSTKIGVVCDSMSDLPPKVSEKHGIVLVPGIVYIDGTPYQSGVDIQAEDLQKLLEDERKNIRTGAPPPAAYYRAYERLYDNVDMILSLHCPTKHSGMLNAAKAAARRLDDSSRIVHFECGVATIGLGITAIAAAAIETRQIEDRQEIIRQVREYCKKIQIVGTLESFKYLQRSGRLKLRVAGWIASTLSVKPVLLMRDSDVFLVERPRNRKTALDLVINSLSENMDREMIPRIVGISHFRCEKELIEVEEKLMEKLPDYTIIRGYADPTVAANTGPGLILVAYFAETGIKPRKGIKVNV